MSKQRMHREADIMQLGGDHRCVVSYVDLFESPSHYYLVMEMASGGELFDRLVARGAYTEASAAKLVGEVTELLVFKIYICYQFALS
jgi:serine/threonine protein kinase